MTSPTFPEHSKALSAPWFSQPRLWRRLPWRWAAALAGALALCSGSQAQLPPQQVVIERLAVSEGNSGSRVIEMPIGFTDGIATGALDFDRTVLARYPMTLRVRTIVASGGGFVAANVGSSCSNSGVDHIALNNVDISIPAGTPFGAVKIPITVCGDTAVEPTEHLFVVLECISGVVCSEMSVAVVSIVNDDGPPTVSIGDVTVTEPTNGTRNAVFPIRLSHPAPSPLTLNFQTQDGTAVRFACRPTGPFTLCSGDYDGRSGTVSLPAGATQGSVSVPVRADPFQEGDERFHLLLSNPVNATLGRARGTVTIRDFSLQPLLGALSLTQRAGPLAEAGTPEPLSLRWEAPAGQSTESLLTLDLRLRGPGNGGRFLRWQRESNSLSVCQRSHGPKDLDDASNAADAGDAVTRLDAVCGPAQPVGQPGLLVLPQATLDLARLRVTADGQGVQFEGSLRFGEAAAGQRYAIDLGSADRFGNEAPFVRAGHIEVKTSRSAKAF